MDEPSEKTDFSDYQTVLNAFIELRSHGIAVSSQDLEVLKSWAEDKLPPELIIKAMEAIALENQEKGKRLASSLKTLDRSVRRAVRNFQDF
ncbi:hypothetical protein EBR21_01255 [bacterium]|nr:hypothetical protein [bacterium]